MPKASTAKLSVLSLFFPFSPHPMQRIPQVCSSGGGITVITSVWGPHPSKSLCWAEDRITCRNQAPSINLADFADRFYKIGLNPDFKEEAEFKNKGFFFSFRAEFKSLPDLKQWVFLWHRFHFELQILDKAHQFQSVYRHRQSQLGLKYQDVGAVNATRAYMGFLFVFIRIGEKLVILKTRKYEYQKI